MNPQEDEDEREETLLGDFTQLESENKSDPCGYYAALGVSQNASQGAIRRAFLHLSQNYHTDKHSSESSEIRQLMNERFQQLQEAYSFLSDEKQRAVYDAGGKQGIERLSLIPQSINRREDIARYLTTLEREAELLRLSKMLSATSNIKLSYALVHFFLPRRENIFSQISQQQEEEEEGDEVMNEEDNNNLQNTSSSSSAVVEEKEDQNLVNTTNNVGETPPKVTNATMTARKIEIDGRTQIVLIPSEELQVSLQQKMNEAEIAAGKTPSHTSQKEKLLSEKQELQSLQKEKQTLQEQQLSYIRNLSFLQKIMIATVPQAISFRHSFQHVLTPSLGLKFRTSSEQEKNRTNISCTTIVEYQPDGIKSYAAYCGASVKGLKIDVKQKRILNSLWSLESKLHCLDGTTILPSYDVSLTRKLSRMWNIENRWMISITEHGYFKTTIYAFMENGLQRGISTFVRYGELMIMAFNKENTTYGDDILNIKGSGRGCFQQNISLLPLSGKIRLSFEAWYYYSKWRHFGIGFMSNMPIPTNSNDILTSQSKKVSINEFALLYKQGNHQIEIPVVAFISPGVTRAAIWLITPWILYRFSKLALKPLQYSRTVKLFKQKRLEHQTEMDLARVKAMHEQKALESSALKNRLIEDRIGGLVIINAKYGVLNPRYPEALLSSGKSTPIEVSSASHPPSQASSPVTASSSSYFSYLSFSSWWRRLSNYIPLKRSNTTNTTNSTTSRTNINSVNGKHKEEKRGDEESEESTSILVIDVTISLQNFVRDSQLILPSGTKSKLVGFTDPDPFTSEKKQLKIIYWFQRKRHSVILNDDDPVELPRREHRIDP